MNAPLHPALLAPVVQTFAVKIVFTDGVYERNVKAATWESARHMALVDARMAHPAGSFYGAVLSISADRPP